MRKYYAVKKGRKAGVYLTWPECQKQVIGYKGAAYKSFDNMEDAYGFLNNNKFRKKNIESVDGVYAYIDGSFDRAYKIYGSGVVIVDGENKYQFKHAGNKEEYAELHNVAGEIEAAKFVMWYAVDKKIPEITIFYDYEGIESWVTGEWKANLNYTKDYVEFARKASAKVKLHFIKVKAHTGVELNELVDSLAKEAIEEFKENAYKKYL